MKHRYLEAAFHVGIIALPLLFAPVRLADDNWVSVFPEPPPAPNAVDVWLEHGAGLPNDLGAIKAASRAELTRPLLSPDENARAPEVAAATATGFAGGFTLVGSVALLPGDDSTVGRVDTGFGIEGRHLAAVSQRFIQAFGDNYDQIAVFLSFSDRRSAQALAYQQPVTNNTRGLGLRLFDASGSYGSEGRMQTVLNMKRINLYGRDAAADPDNGLYAVWAQEAAHRWLVYFRYQRDSDAGPQMDLLGRQEAHWAPTVQADASIMDGVNWMDNGDGTYTPLERGVRYGILDQYGLGLRSADEVPPFFILEDLQDLQGNPVMGRLSKSARYQAKRVDLTIEDIIRANGPRDPATEPAAQDLRMGVVLLGAPGVDPGQLIGEAFQIDNSRRLWTEFYNAAGGGRGKVCSQLLAPCRGGAFSFENLELVESERVKNPDGVVTSGEPALLKVKVTNTGSETAAATVSAQGGPFLTFTAAEPTSPLKPGDSAVVSVPVEVAAATPCAQPLTVDLSAPGALGQSRSIQDVVIGLRPVGVVGFEDGDENGGWSVDPDGDDSGTTGRWAVGAPARAVAFDYTLQPGAAYAGGNAFATGLSDAQEDNVDGRTTLESPPLSLGGAAVPILSYFVYFVAADFGQEVLVPAPSGELRVEASVDGGPFLEVDKLKGMSTGWQRRTIRLGDSMGDLGGKQNVRLRFVAEELLTGARPVVEAVIDEVGIYDEVAACRSGGVSSEEILPPGQVGGNEGSGGCQMAPGSARGLGGGLWGLGAFALLLAGLRRSRPGRRRRARP